MNNNFDAIDKLVSFGVNNPMNQQMINTMNQAMQSMYVPGSMASMPQQQAVPIHAVIDGQCVGPLNEMQFSQLVNENKITQETLVWTPGMLHWEPLSKVPNLLKVATTTPPAIP